MLSRCFPFETGTFHIVRKSCGTTVILHPGGEDISINNVPRHADERSAAADQRAQLMQGMLDRGEVRNRSELAVRFNISRPRVTQILARLHQPCKKGVGQ